MALLSIKRYIRQHKDVSLQDLVNHFDINSDALEGMLAMLIEQGHVLKVDTTGDSCNTGGCDCGSDNRVHFHWLDKAAKPLPIGIELSS